MWHLGLLSSLWWHGHGRPSLLVVPCHQWMMTTSVVIHLVATLLREISARQRGQHTHLGRQNTTGLSPSDIPLSRHLASSLHHVPSTSLALVRLVTWCRFWWSTGDVGGWQLMWAVVATVTVVMGNGGQVSWLMVVWGRGKKFVFVLGYEGCLYLVMVMNFSWDQLHQSFVGLHGLQISEIVRDQRPDCGCSLQWSWEFPVLGRLGPVQSQSFSSLGTGLPSTIPTHKNFQ